MNATTLKSDQRQVQIRLQDIELRYGDTLVQQGLSFDIHRGDVFIVMGGSGCGKSTVMRCLTGLLEPRAGRVLIGGVSLWQTTRSERTRLMRRNGVMYQSGALWSSMTLEENVALPLEQYTTLAPEQIRDIAEYKLALVGLAGFDLVSDEPTQGDLFDTSDRQHRLERAMDAVQGRFGAESIKRAEDLERSGGPRMGANLDFLE